MATGVRLGAGLSLIFSSRASSRVRTGTGALLGRGEEVGDSDKALQSTSALGSSPLHDGGGEGSSSEETTISFILSVSKVVPTLTSKSTEIYLSMAGSKQHNDSGLSWFRPWAVHPAGVRSGQCFALHRSACRGELQARRERRGSL
jgi:hypothetical protein